MKLQFNPSIAATPLPDTPSAGRQPQATGGTEDGIQISIPSIALAPPNLDRLTALVRAGAYHIPSSDVSHAIVSDALG
jgi:hypothetical protein